MEFVLSKVWMVLGGLALAAVVTASFASLNLGAGAEQEMRGAEALSDILSGMSSTPGGEMVIEIKDLVSGDSCFVIRKGSVWLESGGVKKMIPSLANIIMLSDAGEVDELRLCCSDILRINSIATEDGVAVQLEKVDATAWTASTNLLHSSSVL